MGSPLTEGVTGARMLAGCSEGRTHLRPGQQLVFLTSFPVVPDQDALILVLSCLIARGHLVFLAHPLCWAKLCTSKNWPEPHSP